MRQVPNKSPILATFVLPYFTVIMLDAMCFGMINPILAPMISHSNSQLFSGLSPYQIHIIYGLILALSPLCFLFGAPLLGHWADRFGSKRVLMACVLGNALGMMAYVASFSRQSLALLFIARVVVGFTSGSQAIAQAAMAKQSERQSKPANIGIIAVAMTMGLILGPLLGGVLSDAQWVSWFNQSTPFYTGFAFSVLNFIIVWRCLKAETPADFEQHRAEQTVSARNNIINKIGSLLCTHKVLPILITFFLFELSWSLYFQSRAIVLSQHYHLHSSYIGIYSAYIGIALSLALAFLVRPLAMRYSRKIILSMGFVLGAFGLALSGLSTLISIQWVSVVPVAIAVALLYTHLISSLSDRVRAENQGLMMGLSDAALSAAFAITGFLTGWVSAYSLWSVTWIALVFLVLSAACYYNTSRKSLFQPKLTRARSL